MARGERTPEQHRDDQREDNHFLEGTGVKGRIRFEQADQNGTQRSQWVRNQTTDDGAHETFQADQKAGIIVNGGDRRDQDAGKRPNGRSQREAQLAGQHRRNAHQPGTGAVHRGGAQRFAVDGALKEEIQADDK